MFPVWPLLIIVGLIALDWWAATHLDSIARTYGFERDLEHERSSRLFRRRWLLLAAGGFTLLGGIFADGVWQAALFAAFVVLTLAYGSLLFIWSMRSYRATNAKHDRLGR